MSTSQQEIDRLIEQFDPESSFRRLAGWSAKVVMVLCAGLSAWHYYTAGFGLENEIAHRAIHLAVVLGLCFLVFPRQKRLPGHWEWTVSVGLAGFYLFMGWSLLGKITKGSTTRSSSKRQPAPSRSKRSPGAAADGRP